MTVLLAIDMMLYTKIFLKLIKLNFHATPFCANNLYRSGPFSVDNLNVTGEKD